jgi:hypothetical protein
VELIGPYLIACSLLVVAGVAKLARPTNTGRAVAQVLGLPERPTVGAVRLGAGAEAALGLVGIVVPAVVPAALVAFSYLGFAGFVLAARARGRPIASCGCFGTPDTPATGLHVVLDVGLASAAVVVAAAHHPGTIAGVLAHQPLHGVPLLIASAVASWLTLLAFVGLAQLRAARALLERSPETPA